MSFSLSKDFLSIHVGDVLEDPTTIPEKMAWFGWKVAKTIDPYIGHSRRYIRRQRERLGREARELM